MGGYVRGAAISVVIMAILTYVGLLVVDVDYPLVLGLIAGLMEVIPIVGGVVTAILMVLVALTESFTKALITLVLAVALQQFEANVVVPNIMQVEAKTSPLLTLFAVIAGATVGGVVGALVAIPLAAALRILVIEALAPEIRRRLGAAPPDPPSD
jgi:predicted PurR-regulated permease PerM